LKKGGKGRVIKNQTEKEEKAIKILKHKKGGSVAFILLNTKMCNSPVYLRKKHKHATKGE
jgi:hypothetical protein